MSFDVSVGGLIGIILSEPGEWNEPVVNTDFIPAELDARMRKALQEPDPLDMSDEAYAEALNTWEERDYEAMLEPFLPDVEEALRAHNIQPVLTATLTYRDDSQEVGAADTAPFSILYGIGLYQYAPWAFPEIDQSFKDVANLHTWVTGG